MLVISQAPWGLNTLDGDTTGLIRAAKRRLEDELPPLVLLPLADPVTTAPDEQAIEAALGALAQKASVYLAGAAQVKTRAAGQAQNVAYLFDPDGRRLLRTPKIAPRPQQPGDVALTWADLTRARAELGYNPTTALHTGLTAMWRWYSTQTASAPPSSIDSRGGVQ